MRKVFPITVNIYAEEEQEAMLAQRSIGQFINDMGHLGIAVTGRKIAEVVPKWKNNNLIKQQIINYFKQ